MPQIGFSTGALFRERVAEGVDFSRLVKLIAIELSALRMRELEGLLAFVRHADLSDFRYVSLHAPTDFSSADEPYVAASLLAVAVSKRWRVVLHPDCITDFDVWRPFNDLLCIENMDKRKPVGRTVGELDSIFDRLPEAMLCFDIAHARQVDTTMTEAYRILGRFRSRICQLHMSEVTSASKHGRISDAAVASFREVASYIPEVPVILESPVTSGTVDAEVEQAKRVFAPMLVSTNVQGTSTSPPRAATAAWPPQTMTR